MSKSCLPLPVPADTIVVSEANGAASRPAAAAPCSCTLLPSTSALIPSLWGRPPQTQNQLLLYSSLPLSLSILSRPQGWPHNTCTSRQASPHSSPAPGQHWPACLRTFARVLPQLDILSPRKTFRKSHLTIFFLILCSSFPNLLYIYSFLFCKGFLWHITGI